MFSVVIDTTAIRKALVELNGDLQTAAAKSLDEATEAAAQDARATTEFKDRTGELRQSIESGRGTGAAFTSFVRAGAAYASFVEDGTPPHEIVSHGGMLSFVVNGQRIFRRKVNHPGTSPRPFMEHASFVGEVVLTNALEESSEHAIQRFNSSR